MYCPTRASSSVAPYSATADPSVDPERQSATWGCFHVRSVAGTPYNCTGEDSNTPVHPGGTPAGHRRDSGGTAAGPLDPFPLLRGRRAIAGIAELPLRGFDRVDKPLILNLIQPLARFVLRAPALSKLLTELKAKVYLRCNSGVS